MNYLLIVFIFNCILYENFNYLYIKFLITQYELNNLCYLAFRKMTTVKIV